MHVQSGGSPIKDSIQFGFSATHFCPDVSTVETAHTRSSPRHVLVGLRVFQSLATGVGQLVAVPCENEDSPPNVRGSHEACGETIPFRIEPERCQVSEDFCESTAFRHREESAHVFEEDVSGTELFCDAEDFWPEPAIIFLRFALTANRSWLAGKPRCDEIDSAQRLKVCRVDVIDSAIDMRPLCFEDFLAVGVFFNLPLSVAESCEFDT